MKIVFVGSKRRLSYIEEVVKKLFAEINPIYIEDESPYHNEEIAKKLKDIKTGIQGVIFAGELQHEYYNSIFFPNIPCDYLKKDWTSLQNALLKISLKGVSFCNVSIDSYPYSSVQHMYKNLEIDNYTSGIRVIQRREFKEGYINLVIDDHVQFYESGQVSGCVTALYQVYEALSKRGIPCAYARPTTDIIINTIEHIIDIYEHQKNHTGHIAIMIIEIMPKKAYSYVRQDEYLYMHEKLKVAEEIYYFARNTHAAVVSESIDKFTILMNKDTLMSYTHGLQRFYLMNGIHNKTNCDVNIGIGYGFNPSEAKFNAQMASEKFSLEDTNVTYIVPKVNALIGPLNFLSGDDVQINRIEDHYIRSLSKQIGLSQVQLYKLYQIMEREKRTAYTSSELCDKLEVSRRNANRIVRKLEDSGYAHNVGKRLTGESGRPSDVYEINLIRPKGIKSKEI